jgi:hypothetical protein
MQFTAKTTVYVSLVQVGITVFGILAAATSQKVASLFGRVEVFSSELLMDLGLVSLCVPLLWIIVVSVVRVRREVSDGLRRALFISGFLLLALLVLWAACATMLPWTMPRAPEPVPSETVALPSRLPEICHEIELLPSAGAVADLCDERVVRA